MAGMNPAWAASDPTAGGGEPSPSKQTWAPEYKLPTRPASGPVTHERHSLAFELRQAARREQQRQVGGDAADPTGERQPTGEPDDLDLPLDDEAAPGEDSVEAKEAYRYEKQYHDWYFSQHPRDPRVPPPLGNPALRSPAAARVAGGAATGSDTSSKPTASPAGGAAAAAPPMHPLAALRKQSTRDEKPPAKASNEGDAVVPQGTPPPLKGLGPVARPGSNPNTAAGEGSGKFAEASVSLPPNQADPLAAPPADGAGDALEGSAATWIDGLPIPTVTSLNNSGKGGRRGSRSSSKGSRGSSRGSGKRRGRAQPSPLLRQYKEEAAQQQQQQQHHPHQQGSAVPSGRGSALAGSRTGLPPTPATERTKAKQTTPPTARNDGGQLSLGGSSEDRSPKNGGTPVAQNAPNAGGGDSGERPFEQPYNPPRSMWDLTAVAGHIVEFACDQEGSRLIQSLAEDTFSLTAIFCEVHDSLPMLISHQFGNYCAQRLLELGQTTHKRAVMAAMKGRMPALATDTYGCRVIQRALDTFNDETADEMIALAQELEPALADLVVDQNGNHVVQKLMDKLPPHRSGLFYLVRGFTGRMNDLGMHCYGCRVLQKLFETCGDGARFASDAPGSPHLQGAQRAMQELVNDVLANTHTLVVDQYGNYVVQHLVANGSRETRSKAIGTLTPRVAELATQKYSSNVIERMLGCATDQERDHIVAVLSTARTFAHDAIPPIVDLTRDRFANYVVQRVIEHATPSQKNALVNAIVPHIATIRATTYGMHILSRLERMAWIPPGSSGMPAGSGPIGGRGRGRGRGGRGGDRGGGDRGGRGGYGGGMHHGGPQGQSGYGGQPYQQQHQHQQQHGFQQGQPHQQQQQGFDVFQQHQHQHQHQFYGGAQQNAYAQPGQGFGGAPGFNPYHAQPGTFQQHQHPQHQQPQQHSYGGHGQGNMPIFAQQYASLQQGQQAPPQQSPPFGHNFGGDQQQQPGSGDRAQQQGTRSPAQQQAISPENVLAALNYIQQQQGQGQGGTSPPAQGGSFNNTDLAAIAAAVQQLQQSGQIPPGQGGDRHHHDPYRRR